MCKNDREGHSLTPTDTPGWNGKGSPTTQEPREQLPTSYFKKIKNKMKTETLTNTVFCFLL